MKTSVLFPAHRTPMPPGFCTIGSIGLPLLAATTMGALPLELMLPTSATSISHGDSIGAIGDCGVPPIPGCRRKTIFFPSGDHEGSESREVEGAMNRTGCPDVKMPMKLWSVRSEINAMDFPSGDHRGASLVPRTKNACCAPVDPSIGTIQIFFSRESATRELSGEIAGLSPSTSNF